jgi:hypothetical protein
MKLTELHELNDMPSRPTKAEEQELLASLPKVGTLPSDTELQEGLDDSWNEFIEV